MRSGDRNLAGGTGFLRTPECILPPLRGALSGLSFYIEFDKVGRARNAGIIISYHLLAFRPELLRRHPDALRDVFAEIILNRLLIL